MEDDGSVLDKKKLQRIGLELEEFIGMD